MQGYNPGVVVQKAITLLGQGLEVVEPTMRTHAEERARVVIAAAREDMRARDMDGWNSTVHMSDISKRDKEIPNQDFYLEISAPDRKQVASSK